MERRREENAGLGGGNDFHAADNALDKMRQRNFQADPRAKRRVLTFVLSSVSLAADTDSSCCASANSTSATLDITFACKNLGLGPACA